MYLSRVICIYTGELGIEMLVTKAQAYSYFNRTIHKYSKHDLIQLDMYSITFELGCIYRNCLHETAFKYKYSI